MKTKLLKKLRKEIEEAFAIIKLTNGTYSVTHDGYTWNQNLTRADAIEKYKSHVYYAMESKIRKLRARLNQKRKIKFSIWQRCSSSQHTND